MQHLVNDSLFVLNLLWPVWAAAGGLALAVCVGASILDPFRALLVDDERG